MPLLVPLGVGISVLFGGETPVIDRTIVGVLVLLAFSIFPGSALGEELGWRGLALPRLQARHAPWQQALSSRTLGILAPPAVPARPGDPTAEHLSRLRVSVVAASVICTWMYNGTGGSLLIVVLYVALAVAAATAIVVATRPEHLSRTAQRQIEQP